MNITKEDVPYIVREQIVADVFRALRSHFYEGGTYRYLIYDRLGFEPKSYPALMAGLDLSNMAFELAQYRKKHPEYKKDYGVKDDYENND